MKVSPALKFNEILKNSFGIKVPVNGEPAGEFSPLKAGKKEASAAISGEGSAVTIESFANMLKKAVADLNQSQVKADKVVERFLAGDIEDVHQVMIAMEEARLTMQLAVEVRNKIVEAYQEISRMQI